MINNNPPISKQQIEFYKAQIKQARALINEFKSIDVEKMSSSNDFQALVKLYKNFPDAFSKEDIRNIDNLVLRFKDNTETIPRDVIELIDSFMQKLYQMLNDLDKVEDLLKDYEKNSNSLRK